jgi:hypothetical protein
MSRKIRVDVRDFYKIVRLSLEKAVEDGGEHIEGLRRTISALKQLIERGQSTLVVPTGYWSRVADNIEAEVGRIDRTKRVFREQYVVIS